MPPAYSVGAFSVDDRPGSPQTALVAPSPTVRARTT
jgi:hypothetical protein